ncbi:glycosyltransferase family 2 protein [uncultured Roseobacter sp.]|uniref:glycosyltransferase family 2 protein n=1 Tax=uncultured Roseobacter sp. TaxID=114847 RepID=UPI00260C42A9|nr:glycosyltransferase family 2 protein [uncultured Roseobacter sp.]
MATVRADTSDILKFAAHHIEAGADRLIIYLDEDTSGARGALEEHPACTVILCDESYWMTEHGRRPLRHQVRQSQNANHAYVRAHDLDWIAHIDVDEFIACDTGIRETLSALAPAVKTARLRPMEALAREDGKTPEAFKAFVPGGAARRETAARLYPTFGAYIKGGFVSHVAGKLFVRTGLNNIKLRIHNVLQNQAKVEDEVAPDGLGLAHLHTTSWTHWRSHLDYRHAKGSYRSELRGPLPPEQGGMNLHDLFSFLIRDQGEAGLRAFYDEVCADTPELRSRLQAAGLLRRLDLDLNATAARHFPGVAV